MKFNRGVFVFLFPSVFSFAGDFKDSEDMVVVSSSHEGEGYTFQINVHDVGEPIGKPIRMSVVLDCSQGESHQKIQLLDKMPVCDYKSYEFEKSKHTLKLNYLEGVYNEKNQSVSCQLEKTKTLHLEESCSKAPPPRVPQNSKPKA